MKKIQKKVGMSLVVSVGSIFYAIGMEKEPGAAGYKPFKIIEEYEAEKPLRISKSAQLTFINDTTSKIVVQPVKKSGEYTFATHIEPKDPKDPNKHRRLIEARLDDLDKFVIYYDGYKEKYGKYD